MANATEVPPGASVSTRSDQCEKRGGGDSKASEHREKKCVKFIRTATVAAMIIVVWGLVIVAVTFRYWNEVYVLINYRSNPHAD